MQGSEHQFIAERHPELPAYQSPAPVSGVTSGSAALLDPLELESLKLIMDASLRVHARHHFSTWTQVLLQDLATRQTLIYALRDIERMDFRVERLSACPHERALVSDLLILDT